MLKVKYNQTGVDGKILFFLIIFSGLFTSIAAQSDTVMVSIPEGQFGSYCMDIESLPGEYQSISNLCPFDSGTYANVTINPANNGCIDYFGHTGGIDEACIVVCDNEMNCDSVFLLIEVLTPFVPCLPVFTNANMNLSISNCSEMVEICLPITTDDLATYTLTVNNVIYDNGIDFCNIDSTLFYDCSLIFGGGTQGPYSVDSWEVNGIIFTGAFNTIPDLVDSLNFWDTAGNWTLDDSGQGILGAQNDSVYGTLVISKSGINGTAVTIGLSYFIDPLGTAIELGVGSHELILAHGNGECFDTMNVFIACLPSEYYDIIVYYGSSGSICLETDDLIGSQIVSVTNACAESSGNFVEFSNGSFDPCISYDAIEVGVDEACYVLCDNLGFCDTTFISIAVQRPIDGVVVQTILIEDEIYYCLDTTELIGQIDTMYNICQGDESVDFFVPETGNCIEYTGIAAGLDSACVVICDDLGGCDTTMFYITVQPLTIPIPTAENDIDTTFQNESILIDITANDTLSQSDVVRIMTYPENGKLETNIDGTITFIPNEDFCGIDDFTYQLCNPLGECTQALVTIQVLCGDIFVYNGFSPNGDQVNEVFKIDGLEAYPDHHLQIFNRWGSLVYESYDYKNNWTGKWENADLPEGVYIYMLEVQGGPKSNYSGTVVIKKGL